MRPGFFHSSTLLHQTLGGGHSRGKQAGASLAIFIGLAGLLIAFLGVAIYTGIQSFVEFDLQRASMNAAMSGAAAYYTGATPKALSPNATIATGTTTNTFNNIVSSSTLGGFNAAITKVSNNDNNDSVTVDSEASIPTPFLSLVGIDKIAFTSSATARALRYEPTAFTGPVNILPTAGNIASYSKKIKLAFPLVDGPGYDLYVEQDAAYEQAYIVEGCNKTECYSLVEGATPLGLNGKATLDDGKTQVLIGSALIDIGQAGVRKASYIRIVHANNYMKFNAGVPQGLMTKPTPLTIQRVMLFGYAGACVSPTNCPIPAGFAPVF